jgi:high-affinity Fe2+/Pb2+ permease
MTFLLALAVRWGVPERFQRLAAWVMGVVAVIALLGLLWGGWHLWLARHDRAIVRDDRAAANAAVSNKAAAADNVAASAQAARDADFANDQAALKEKSDEAAANRASPLDVLFNELW